MLWRFQNFLPANQRYSFKRRNFKAFAFFLHSQLVCTTIVLFFASPHENVFIAFVGTLISLCFCALHAFKYKFYDENYKKCISCDSRQHQQKNYFPLDAPCYEWSMFVFMAVWWLMCIYIYACFVAVARKNIIYILRSWNWSATLYNPFCLSKGFKG